MMPDLTERGPLVDAADDVDVFPWDCDLGYPLDCEDDDAEDDR